VAKAWSWLKQRATQVLGACVALLLLALGVGWLWRRQALGGLKDKLKVTEVQRDIAGLDARREALQEQSAAVELKVEANDTELAENQRQLDAPETDTSGMDAEEVSEAFKALWSKR